MERRYEFYGSPAALYSRHTANELGITQGGLNNYLVCNLKARVRSTEATNVKLSEEQLLQSRKHLFSKRQVCFH